MGVQVAERHSDATPRPRVRWWREVLYVLGFYGIYTLVRNQFGSAGVGPERAFGHALRVIHVEESLGLFHEATIQGWFISWHWFIRFWNVYYGAAHFILTGLALIWCYRHRPAQAYVLWRNTLATTTALALVGFSTFPLMPPRLLNSPLDFGGGHLATVHYGFVDTLEKIGGLWSFDSGTMAKLSNQYAAMPSLHCAWATWVALVLWPMARRPWAKVALVLYPVSTLFCIIVTANHYWLDAVGGLVTLGAGYVIATWLTRWVHGHRPAPDQRALDQKTL